MNKVIFLDRDGVVNVERGEYTWRVEDFELTVGLIDFLSYFKNKDCLVIIISNQGCIGKGICTQEDVEKAHNYLYNKLSKHELSVAELYYCPHHPNSGKCLCRKPEPIMLEKAIARYDVDVKNSVFIGDSARDSEAGKKVGLNTIQVKPNDNLMEYCNRVEELLKLV